jgi:iron complex outermembrane receptor protein
MYLKRHLAVMLCSIYSLPSLAAAQTSSAPATESAEAAEQGVGEIIVSARRRDENAQRVPVVVSVVAPTNLIERGGSVADLVQLVPGLQQNAFNDRSNISFGIRGQTQTFGTLFPAVITYFSGVPLTRLSNGQSFDIDSVQVLKGPQGTLFGRVTDGGAILMTPKKPTNNFEGYIEGRYGNYDQRQVQGALNVPILDDKIIVRAAFDVNRRDGFTYNERTGRFLDDVSYESARLTVALKPTDNFDISLMLNYNHASTNGSGIIFFGFNPLAVQASGRGAFIPALTTALANQRARGARRTSLGSDLFIQPEDADKAGVFYKRQVLYAVANTSWHITPDIELKNIFGYVWNKERYANDYDGTGDTDFIGVINSLLPGNDSYIEQYSNETQLQGKILNDALQFTLGVYLDKQQIPGQAETFVPLLAGSQNVTIQYPATKSRAAYAQIAYDLGPLLEGLKLDAGIRYTHDTIVSRNAGYFIRNPSLDAIPHGQCLPNLSGYPGATLLLPCTTFTGKSNVVTYTIGLSYQVASDVFLYAQRRKGYRPGGVNAVATNPLIATYGPEYDISHEVGIKADWSIGGMKLRTNLSAFSDDYTHIQRFLQVVSPQGASANAVINAAAATIKGFELESALVPFAGLTLSGTWAYLDASYKVSKFDPATIPAACPANLLTTRPLATAICPYDPLPQSPKHTVRAQISYDLPLSEDIGKITFGGDMYYVTDSYVSGRYVPAGTVPAYTVYNASVRWASVFGRPFDLSFFINNITNKLYLASSNGNLAIGEAGFSKGMYGPPRMYGLSVHYAF